LRGKRRRTSNNPFLRFGPETKRRINIHYGSLRDLASLERASAAAEPDEVYNLAAQSDVGISFLCPEETFEINHYGCGRIVNAALRVNPKVRIYQASTSEMFGNVKAPQSEKSPMKPVSPYGLSKLKAHEDFVLGYRERHGVFICSGILFNHESPRRAEHFVTRKITLSLARIALGLQGSFSLGNLSAKRDWGFAPDYVEAMWQMLQGKKPDDFVVATGESHTVREFTAAAAEALGIKIRWQGKGKNERGIDNKGRTLVKVDPKFYRPFEVNSLRGDSGKARRILGWRPKVAFRELAKIMAEADLALVRREII
jgi:GDPmannose 4,6-dehydratase